MSRPVYVHFLPELFEPDDLRGSVAVMIDVLRASTTIVHALAAGARAVSPFVDVEEVRRESNRRSAGTVVTGGERGGKRIEGFDLGNSPLEFTAEMVRDKTVLFTTTNGTRALERCRMAGCVLTGAFVNLSAVVAALVRSEAPVHVVCAGTDGQITNDDVLCAGAIVVHLQAAGSGSTFELNDEAQMAAAFFRMNGGKRAALLTTLRASRGGRNLVRLGFDRDIERAAAFDLFDIVGQYDPSSKQIGIATRAA